MCFLSVVKIKRFKEIMITMIQKCCGNCGAKATEIADGNIVLCDEINGILYVKSPSSCCNLWLDNSEEEETVVVCLEELENFLENIFDIEMTPEEIIQLIFSGINDYIGNIDKLEKGIDMLERIYEIKTKLMDCARILREYISFLSDIECAIEDKIEN
jgi:hypothetical protein